MNEINYTGEVSYRGNPIPEVVPQSDFKQSDSKQVIDKIASMSNEQLKGVTIEAIHYSNEGISDVKLTTGDIVPVETAIALAENRLLVGITTGKTVRGGRVLRVKPSTDIEGWHSIHNFPQF